MIQNSCHAAPSSSQKSTSFIDSQKVQRKIGIQIYQKIVVDLLEVYHFHESVHSLFQTYLTLTQICEQLGLFDNTKFYSRKILDLALLYYSNFESVSREKMAIACTILAFQMNKEEASNQKMNYVEVFQCWREQYNLNDILAELRMILQNYDIAWVNKTPFDLVSCALSNFCLGEKNQMKIKEGISMMIDLTLSNPEAGKYTCEEIFEGSWFAFAQTKLENKVHLLPQCSYLGQEVKSYLLNLIQSQ